MPHLASAQDLKKLASELSLVPALLRTTIPHPESAGVYLEKSATCFALSIKFRNEAIRWFILSNYHPFKLIDEKGTLLAKVDSGKVFRNAKDTVIAIRVKLLKINPRLDLALLRNVDNIPLETGIERSGIQIDLFNAREPLQGERTLYSGFPLLLGQDTIKQNFPLVIEGIVSQSIPGNADFIVQAPVFSGASGSPILSQTDGQFLGVLYGKVPGQESLLYAVKASAIRNWVQSIILEDIFNTQQKNIKK